MSEITPAPADPVGFVDSTASGGIATITFGHPRGNSLPGSLLRRLAAAFDAVGADDSVRVVQLRSDGTGPFCAGASFDELRSIGDAAAGQEFFSGFAHVLLAMRRCPHFVVTRVQGKAVGGGVGLVAGSDYVIAHEDAQLRLSELAVGIGPFVVGPAIERKIGHGHFAALSIDHDWRSAAWAVQAGLYTRMEPSLPALDAVMDGLLKRLAATSPDAMRQLKRVLWEGTDRWETLLFERAAMSGSLILGTHARQALARLAER